MALKPTIVPLLLLVLLLALTIQSTVSSSPLDLSDCGVKKGCYRSPPGCAKERCDHILTWRPTDDNSDEIEFELRARLTNKELVNDNWCWTAVGFSYDEKMQNTSVVDCILNATDSHVIIQSSYNDPKDHKNVVLTSNSTLGLNLTGASGQFAGNHLLCRFRRQITVPWNETDAPKVFNLTEVDKYYLFLPKGPASKDGVKQQHIDVPVISPIEVSLSSKDFLDIGGQENVSVALNLTECGDTKGCFRYPNQCKEDGCDNIVTWRDAGDNIVEFELFARVSQKNNNYWPWVAIGFSHDTKMPNTSVISCIMGNDSKLFVEASFNENHTNEPLNDRTLGIVAGSLEGSYMDGVVKCSFKRYKDVWPNASIEAAKVYDLRQNNSYYFIMATGPANVSGYKSQHSRYPLVSPVKVTINDNLDLGGQKKFPLVQAHATLMIFAWVLCACIGMFVARNMKTYRSRDTWFAVHRGLMILTLVCAIAGLGCILFETKATVNWKKPLHPIFGIICLSLAFINPIMAVLRPSKDSPRRPAFNWAHYIVGTGVHLMSVIAIWMGTMEEKANMADWSKWLVLAFILFRDVIEISLTIIRKKLQSVNYRELNTDMHMGDEKLDLITLVYLIVYIVGLLMIAAALLYNLFY